LTTELTQQERRTRIKAALEAGFELCRVGNVKPTVGMAVWELMVEAAETLKRMPDREAVWLSSGGRSSMPETFDHTDFADIEGETRRAPPSKDAIDRMEEVLSWYQLFSPYRGRKAAIKWRRDVNVVFSLASGLPRHAIAGKARCSEDHLGKILERQLRAVAFELQKRLKSQ
jgi:hypothetical protein